MDRVLAPKGPATGAAGLLAVGQAFGVRYHIIRLLGAGGMGAVYQAWDAELGVSVALKVVKPRATDDAARAQELERRFKRELLLARQVTHANVVRIHDLGEIDGIRYLTMTYVEGTDLSKLLAKGKLPLGSGPEHREASGLRAAGGPPGRCRPPRPQARQRHDRRGRRADHGLRHRALDVERHAREPGGGRGRHARQPGGGCGRRARDPGGGRGRHLGLHGARAGTRRAGRPSRRHLRLRADPLRHAARPVALGERFERLVGAEEAHAAGGARHPLGRSRDPQGRRAHRVTLPGKGSSGPLPEDGRAGRRAAAPG